jgi:hypothetical protein
MPPAAKATMISGKARIGLEGGETTGGGMDLWRASSVASDSSSPSVSEIGGKAAPQPVQMRALTSSTLPHDGQGLRSSGTPQAAQKRSPGLLSCWQLGQCESSIGRRRLKALLTDQE